MPDAPTFLSGAMLVSLVFYALLGGADFGGGVWALLSRGQRAADQRRLVASAIGPVWETNHIWVIVAVVVLFTAFPRAFAVVSTALFVPVTLLLAGVVLRGAGFAFHSYRLHDDGEPGRWGAVFAASSLLSPVLLGVTVGAMSSGKVRTDSLLFTGDTSTWLAPFPLSVGLLTLAVFSYIAAAYLTLETPDPGLQDDFRARALWSASASAFLSVLVPVLARSGAPDFYKALTGSDWSVPLVILTGTSALGAYVALQLRVFSLARACAALQSALIILGWGLAQFPYLVRPNITVYDAAASPSMLRMMIYALVAGAAFLFPSVAILFRIFKKDALSGRHARRG